jgi:hypothetical protein
VRFGESADFLLDEVAAIQGIRGLADNLGVQDASKSLLPLVRTISTLPF